MNPFGEDPAVSRERELQAEKSVTCPGTVFYEEGLQVQQISGFIIANVGIVVVFGDNGSLVAEQERTLIPMRRIIRVQLDAP
jgi:hypothetical protein